MLRWKRVAGVRRDPPSPPSKGAIHTTRAIACSIHSCHFDGLSPIFRMAAAPIRTRRSAYLHRRSPSIGISGKPSMFTTTGAPVTVTLLMAMLRKIGVRSETGSSGMLA